MRRFDTGRRLQLEPLEARQLLTLGPQLIGVQPNQGELLRDGDIRNIAPQELIFRFNEGQVIDEATLDAIQVTRAGADGQFSQAVTRTDFNTQGAVVVQFQAVEAGPVGNDIELAFTKSDPGGARLPHIRVEGKTIHVELNTNPLYRSRVSDLLTALHQNSDARDLVQAQLVSGPASTQIATPEILYSPVRLSGANVAEVSTDFGTGTNLDITFTATQVGSEANGTRIEITRRDRGGAAAPVVQVPQDRHIRIELNSNPGNETTAEQLVAVFNAHSQAGSLATADLRVGNPNANIATSAIDGQTLMLAGADDMVIEPGYVGLGDSPHEVIFRFAERLPDDRYRVDIAGSGSRVLRNQHGFGLNDATDNQIDDGADFSLEFELDLGPQVMAVVPQPIVRMADGSLAQRTNQIEIFFNDDELDPIRATDPAYYQLIDTSNTVSPWDDVVHRPKQVQYFPDSNRVMLTFDKALDRLSPGGNVLRLRIGTNEKVPDQQHQDQMKPVLVDLRGSDSPPGSSFATAYDVGMMSDKALADGRLIPDTRIISAAIEPQINEIVWPGSRDEPGHRSLLQYRFDRPLHSHLSSVADPNPGITTLFYNFREDYGNDPAGNPLTNLITEQQKQRAREAFEIYGRQLGVQFVESATQGFTIATGDIRAISPTFNVEDPDTALHAVVHAPLDNDLMLVLSHSTNWYEGFGEPEDVARPSWFETALGGIGELLGIGDTRDLLPRPVVLPLPEPEPVPDLDDENGEGDDEDEDEEVLPPETEWVQAEQDVVYPADQAVVLGQHLYRLEGDDIDIYRFELDREGLFSAETVAQRREDASLLDTVLRLYRAVPGGGYELLARNDDYFGRDSFLEMELGAGTYFVGVSSSGNADYNPIIEDSGSGGTTEGEYDLRLSFRPEALKSIVDIDNRDNEAASELSRRTPLDGDGDGVPGGVFNFWFRANAPLSTVYVDKSAPSGGTGELLRPYNNIPVAMANVPAGGIVRIVGNGGDDGQLHTPEDALAYEIGFDSLGRPLADGSRLHVPQGVTVMIDRGAVFKLRRADLTVGSLSPSVDRSGAALQVLGTPRLLDMGGNVIHDATGREVPGSVYFTSYNDESLGGDSNPAVPQTPAPGDWGGLMFRNDVDRANDRSDLEREGIFLNVINQADIRYGGGTVILQGVPRVIAPIDMSDARPTISFNHITHSADAALAANPNSFEETHFSAPQYQGDQPFTSDYTRVGPHVHNNRLVDNSINGLFVRVLTPAGDRLQEMTVSGRWDNTDVVHVVAEKLRIAGNPGGPLQTVTGPDVSPVRLQATATPPGELEPGRYRYRLTFVDADGQETPASDPTGSVLVRVIDEETGETQSVRLTDLPVAPEPYVGRRLYRSDKDEYVLVARLDASSRTHTDLGEPADPEDPEIGRLLEPSLMQLQPRLPGSLRIDPGTVVKLNKGSIETSFGGQLIAEGLEHSRIIFTSLQDPRYGAGGTFRTGGDNDLQAGDWAGLYAGPVSRLSLDHAVVAYGGGLSEVSGRFTGFNAVEIHQAEARIANSVFHDHASGVGPTITRRSGRGTNSEAVIFVRGAQPVILQNVLRDNDAPAISINVNALNQRHITDPGRSTGYVDASPVAQDNRGPLIRLNRLDNNAINGMHVRGGTVTTQGIWDDTDIAHVILDERIVVNNQFAGSGLRLESSGTESLVVKLGGFNAGFTAGGHPLDIPDRIGGVLQVVGQPGYPVVLTSLRDDSVAAGFRPDGSPLFDTNNDAVRDFSPEGMPLLPTLPDVPQGTLIDNNVPGDIPGHFQFQPRAGGSGIERVTAQGNTQLFQNASFIFDFLNYIDVGLPGQGINLGATTITQPPTWTGPDEVTSRGTFMGQNGPVEWTVRSYFLNGLPTLFNEVSFSSEAALGDLRYINYLDADLLGGNDNLLYLPIESDSPDFQVFTLDDIERIGYSQGGIYEPGPQLVNATWDGWAAGSFPNLKTDITGRLLPPAGEPDEDEPLGPQPAEFSRTGEVDITTLAPFHDPDLGLVYGPGDVTTAFAWSVDPSATSATVTTYLSLVYQDPTTLEADFSGDWDSVRLEEYSHDRNVAVVRERETGDPEEGGINDTPETSQYIGHLAPHEKAGDDVRRLGFEVHGSLNRPADVDVYSFDAVAGTEVWFDIDRTSGSLDTVLELIDDTGRVLARSVNSLEEAKDPGLLTYATPLGQHQVNPLHRSPFLSRDFDSTNPRDAGMRVILPGSAGTTNLYHVRVRSNTEPGDLDNLRGGLTKGMYQLQIRLQEMVERPGSLIHGADIRYASTGIQLVGLPGRSPLTGEAAEIVDPDSPTGDNNNELADAQALGNLLNTDRGTLSVAGTLFTDDDVDWYEFEVRYDSVPGEDSEDPRHLAAVFDIDYADGMARPNTNLWVFDDLGRLVLIGGDSNTPDDRPAGPETGISDLARGSVGVLDPYIGTVQLPASGFTPGRYYVAVSSNAVLPAEMEQFLNPAAANPLVRLEPINSVDRIAEDRIGSSLDYTTAHAPTIPVLFGDRDRVTLFPPAGNQLRHGETFTITNAAGNWKTYEFTLDGEVRGSHVPVPFRFDATAVEIGEAIALAIEEDPPHESNRDIEDEFDWEDPDWMPTPGQPVIISSLVALPHPVTGEVELRESVFTLTLLKEVTRTDFLTSELEVTPLLRPTFQERAPDLRQLATEGTDQLSVFVSRPAIQPFSLGDVTMFVSQPGGFLNRTELLSVDPFTGVTESRIGAFTGRVRDIAMDPRGLGLGTEDEDNDGGIFAYTTPITAPRNDNTAGNYLQINPGGLNPAELASNLGDDGIETYQADPADRTDSVRSGENGVGVFFEAMTFNNAEADWLQRGVRGFAIGTRGDTFVDPETGEIISTAVGIPNPANILFEFNPTTGEALNPPGLGDRSDGGILVAGGTQIRDRGALDTTVDAFPDAGGNTMVTGVDATIIDEDGTTWFAVEDGDIFHVDETGDGLPDVTFEFDSGPEFYFDVNPVGPNPLTLLDGDTFIVDGVQFEFDTGSVLTVEALTGNELADGGSFIITDDAPSPTTAVFEFDNDGDVTSGAWGIPFATMDNQQSILNRVLDTINSVPNFTVQAVQLPGTNRITLLRESPTAGVVLDAPGMGLFGQPGVAPNAIRIPVEEIDTVEEIGRSISQVIDGTQPGVFEAGAVGNRVNFLGALDVDFEGVTNPVFSTINPTVSPPIPTGTPGTNDPLAFPVPFLATDNPQQIAARVHAAVSNAGFSVTLSGANVILDPVAPPEIQPTFISINLGTPPLLGAIGVPDSPLRSGALAPGGLIKGMAFIGDQLYTVTDTGALFRVASAGGGAFNPDSQFNVADYVEGSQEILQAVNPVEVPVLDPVTEEPVLDPVTGEPLTEIEHQPIRFAGLTAGPQNAEGGRYANMLFGIDESGRVFAFDTYGTPQPVFANGAFFIETGVWNPGGLAFSNLDDNLWHVTHDPEDRRMEGHGVRAAFDGSRADQPLEGNASLYFGYESAAVQSQFGTGAFAPATPAHTYDFPGGAHGSLISNPFSLAGYSSADRPTLYFNYFLETQQPSQVPVDDDDDDDNGAPVVEPEDWMLDAFRVYVSGDDGSWQLLATNNGTRDPDRSDYGDEFDPFMTIDPVTGEEFAEQQFARSELFDSTGTWRQARVDLGPVAGQSNLRLRFEFNTAGGSSTGGRVLGLDLNVAGNELRALSGAALEDGQFFTLTDLVEVEDENNGELRRDVVAAFEFDMGPSLILPTGAAVSDGDRFNLDGRIYEFDTDGTVGVTGNIRHTAIPFSGDETAAELSAKVLRVLRENPPPPQVLDARDYRFQPPRLEPDDTLDTAFQSPLDGSTQTLTGIGSIGDDLDLGNMDVDLVAFPLEAGGSVRITTSTTGSPLNSFLRLFDASGNEVARDPKGLGDPTRTSELEFTATRRGTYYVGISGSHNREYLPTVRDSGTAVGTPTQGFYTFEIAVRGAAGPQRVSNRVNLPNAREIEILQGDQLIAEGAGGVSAEVKDSQSQPVPVFPVRVHAGMTSLHVADAIRIALAEHLANGQVEAFPGSNEIVQIVQYGIGDAGPLGLSGPSDPRTAVPGSGLFGDLFGGFGLSAGPNGQVTDQTPGALGMQNNRFEGVYIDDIIIGFAARGEMVTGGDSPLPDPENGDGDDDEDDDDAPVLPSVAFVPNTAQPENEINRGAYQLEIRQATPYGVSMQETADGMNLLLTEGFDINDRLARGVSMTVQDGSFYAHGQTFRMSAGGNAVVTFEFRDVHIPGPPAPANVPIVFDPAENAATIARRIRDAINRTDVQNTLGVRATSSDGRYEGAASTSSTVHLFGEISVLVGQLGHGPTGQAPVPEPNDTLEQAIDTRLAPGGREGFFARGVIGNNPELAELGADVDLYRVELAEGELITVDINASVLNSPLDSLLRVFDSEGEPVRVLDEFGREVPLVSDDDLAPGEDWFLDNIIGFNSDSYLTFVAPADGVYYFGVSAFGNDAYDPQVAGSGRPGQTGHYAIRMDRPLNHEGVHVTSYDRLGDQNTFRDQGQVIVDATTISYAQNFGIEVMPGARTEEGAPWPGPVRNLAQLNTWGIIPGVTLSNNLLIDNGLGGILLSGEVEPPEEPLDPDEEPEEPEDPDEPPPSDLEQAAPVPFARVINNTIAGTIRESIEMTDLVLTPVDGLTGDEDDERTRVWVADLSTVSASTITSLTIRDASWLVESGTGRYSGFDLDAVKIGTELVESAEDLPELEGLKVFDFSPVGTVLTPGRQQEPVVDLPFFGTLDGQIDNRIATLGEFDAVGTFGFPAFGFVSMGLGGSVTFHFQRPLDVPEFVLPDPDEEDPDEPEEGLYLYIGGVAPVNELGEALDGGLITAHAVSPGEPSGVGIRVQGDVTPTLLNNVMSTLRTGIEVEEESGEVVVGGSLYHNNLADTEGIGLGEFALVADPEDPLFVDPERYNYYPAAGSLVVDSSLNSIEDRFEMIQLRSPLGIAPAPMLAPTYDLAGQLRVDDPTAAPPPGMGSNVFKDRGALDRADFEGPRAQLRVPLDNGPDDRDPTESLVNLVDVSLNRFEIQLADGQGMLRGIGVDDASVTRESVQIVQDGRRLVQGVDYRVTYNSTSNLLRLTPLAGVWDRESAYVIHLAGQPRHALSVAAGDKTQDGDRFRLTDRQGQETIFEFDSGYVLTIPQTLALQIPAAGGGPGGVADGDTITVTTPTRTVTLELDRDGAVAPGNIRVPFTRTRTQGEIADAIVSALKGANVRLSPINAGGGRVHLGVDGTQTMSVVSDTIIPMGVAEGIVDGQRFRIDDGSRVVTFEFTTDQFVSTGSHPVHFTYSQTHEQIAANLAAEINGRNLGLTTRHLGDGIVQLGGDLNHQVTNVDANVTLSGQPGAQLPFGLRIPTRGGSFAGLITDGQTFVISREDGPSVTFEFDNNNRWTPGNTPIPFTAATSTWELANTLVNRIRTSDLELFPYNLGNGIVILGADADYRLDVSDSNLRQTGEPGQPAAVRIPFEPAARYGADEGAQKVAQVINQQQLPGISATVEDDRVWITGAEEASGQGIRFVDAIRDLAGNPLQGNQDDGQTRFTIFLGLELDYGDAPAPYPTLRADDGARHQILDGFSLGPTVFPNADGQPHPRADAHPDDDGVVFDPNTPLIPGRKFNVTVDIRGVDGPEPVAPFAVLNAWIDFNRDGDWADPGERILSNVILDADMLENGKYTFEDLVVPANAVPGETFARFRLSTEPLTAPTGEASAGEVEDHLVVIQANPWQNQDNRFDVNADGHVSPMDALVLINYINQHGPGPLPSVRPSNEPRLDVNGDGIVSPLDVIQLINHINGLQTQQGSGEGEAGKPLRLANSNSNQSHLDDVLALDEDWSEILDDVGGAQRDLDARDAIFANLD